jgi:transmembrane sensor
MKAPIAAPNPSAARRARAEAAAWLARLHGNQRTAAVERGWRQWMSEHPSHVTAWELATDTWCESGNVPGVPPSRVLRPTAVGRQMRRYCSFAAAVVVCLLVASLVVLYLTRQSITTALGEQRTLNLADGTRVELNTNTRLSVRFDDRVRTVILSSGEAYFNVAHERRPFVVKAGTRKVIALGTAFLVRCEGAADDALTVTLIEGRVAVAPVEAPNVMSVSTDTSLALLSAGKRLRVARHALTTIDTPSINQETAWMRGQLIFENTPLREAASEFNRYNTVKIQIASQQAEQILVGGIFRIGDAASFATVVAEAHHLRVIVRDRQLILEPSQNERGEVPLRP